MNPQDNFIQEAVERFEARFKDSFSLGAMDSWKSGEVVIDFLLSTLEAQKSHIKETLLAQIPDGKNEDHICVFNDGAQSCDCYHAARKEDRALINNI